MDEGRARDLTPLEKAKKYRNDETRRGIRATTRGLMVRKTTG